ncbi:hypothetical protein [Methanobrevibacter sp.]|uniref:hypothetical protein n=1 Tax=Methanobrevibacter sp. TaxID=66852 RepID=UPI00388DB5CD
MKFNSKYAYILSAFFVLAIVISSVGAADLVKGDFGNEGFQIDIPSGGDFSKAATTNLKFGDMSMNMDVFENKGDNAKDISSIIYFKDGTPDKQMVSDMFADLKKDGKVIEETDNYVVVENQNSNDFLNFDIGNGFDDLWNFATGIFGGDNSVDVSTQDADVKVSPDKGINVADAENNTVSISSEGLHINDASGEDVSISADGVKVSGGNDSDGESADANVSVDADAFANIYNGDYFICIKNSGNDQLIILTGNDLDLMKSIAETASFSEK